MPLLIAFVVGVFLQFEANWNGVCPILMDIIIEIGTVPQWRRNARQQKYIFVSGISCTYWYTQQ